MTEPSLRDDPERRLEVATRLRQAGIACFVLTVVVLLWGWSTSGAMPLWVVGVLCLVAGTAGRQSALRELKPEAADGGESA